MEITEKHLEDAFQRLEIYAIQNANNDDEYHGILFSAGIMKDQLRCVLKAGSEEDLEIHEEFARECMRILKEMDGDLLSYRYKCGHGVVPVVVNTTIETLATYMEWKNDKRGLCLECWLKKRKELRDDMKPEYVKKTVVVEIPVCPKCGGELEEEKDPDARILYHLKCSCGYRY